MSLRKLKGIKSVGAYTPQRSVVEHLLLLEEIILQEIPNIDDIPTARTFFVRQLQQYKAQHQIHNPFGIEDIQHYLLTTTEKKLRWEQTKRRGFYTSALIQQAEGEEPITIDMQGNEIDCLFYAINTPRHITINNTTGDETGSHAGSDRGQANLTINNTKGNYTGAYAGDNQGKAQITINNTTGDRAGESAGSENGQAQVTINNTTGDWTGAYAGYNQGNAQVTINNTKGDSTGAYAGIENGTAHLIITRTEGDWTGEKNGIDHGKGIIVGYNNKGIEPFLENEGIIVNYNPNEKPKIKGITRRQRTDILNLIAQNAPPEKIMAYLRGNI